MPAVPSFVEYPIYPYPKNAYFVEGQFFIIFSVLKSN